MIGLKLTKYLRPFPFFCLDEQRCIVNDCKSFQFIFHVSIQIEDELRILKCKDVSDEEIRRIEDRMKREEEEERERKIAKEKILSVKFFLKYPHFFVKCTNFSIVLYLYIVL